MSDINYSSDKGKHGLSSYVTPLGAWALAFGCSVGWGAFVMPGTTFLPVAGPVGTALGIGIGAVIMMLIGLNYHFLMNKYPGFGGTYTYTSILFGYDHGFLNAWFLILTYVAIIWANASALPLIARNLLGDTFQTGFHYEIAGFQIYMGEILLAVSSLVLAALVCLNQKLAIRMQTAMALLLCIGIVICVIFIFISPQVSPEAYTPAFSPEKKALVGTFTIIALAPWAFVGFESISHSAGEFSFSHKKSFKIMAVAVIAAACAYIILAELAIAVLPSGCASWPDYILHLDQFEGLQGLPTFFAAESLIGETGSLVLALTTIGAIVTGLIGNFIAASRLIYALAEDRMLPEWFGVKNEKKVPRNAILFVLGISVIFPFLGRTAISWIVDVTTVGATIAYAYTSTAAYKAAKHQDNKLVIASGKAGLVISLIFALYFLVPNLLAVTTLSTESYLILSAWGILGFLFFAWIFRRDDERRLGRSTVTWVVLLVLIIFTSTVWLRQSTEAAFLRRDSLDFINYLTRNILIEVALILAALGLLFYIYSLMQKREKQIEVEKALAEESSRAKTSFLSNMSHEIRTPMNAIIGLGNIALRDPDLPPRTREQLEKIDSSARHLLGLINDILDMSRIESGRMSLKEEEFSFRTFLDQINIIINGQCADKGLDYECRIIGKTSDYYYGDDMKLKQVLINILGNSVKFTPTPGSVTFTVEQVGQYEGYNTLRFVMKDTGIGMSKDYIPRIFEAFSQEDESATNRYGSTGLGMSITKSIVEMMNGEIRVDSEKGVGTTFTVTVTLKSSNRSAHQEHGSNLPEDFRALIVDDDEVACEHAYLVTRAIGIEADISSGGWDALGRIRELQDKKKPYQLIILDYRMPDIDGIELTRKIRQIDGGTTMVIMLTGYNWDDMKSEVKKAGVDGVLAKPLFTDSLMREIQSIMLKRDDPGKAENTSEVNASVAPYAGSEDNLPDHEEEILEHLSGRRMLVVEDMEINADILMDLLEMEDMLSEHAENGQIAIDMFSEHPEGYYDAVLMDIRMPVMDGLTATRAIRDLDRPDAKTIPIIAMTANAFDEDVQRSLQAGMNAHITKPVDSDRLYETLFKLV